MSQPIIKLLLIAAVLIFGLAVFRGGRQASYRLLWRIYGILVAAAALLSILFPNSVTRLANSVGVQRGADLLLYLLVVTFMFVSVALFRRLSELEQRSVKLARLLALHEVAIADRSEGRSA
ncbi:DUF2304 domain-containing protein [Nocardioides salsibiostraticola]